MAAAARREVLEETGIEPITIDRILGLFHSQREGKDDHVALFLARAGDDACQRIGAADPREIEAAAWFATDALPDDTSPATRRRIDAYLTGAPEGDQW
jgi:ADP-ribose pyrophosphatase YjhB (NUDIX family)